MKPPRILLVACLVGISLLGLTASATPAADINLVPYYATGGDGDWWTYRFVQVPASISNPAFTLEVTMVQTLLPGNYYKIGPDPQDWPNATTYRYGNADATHIYLYDASGTLQDTIYGIVPLDTLIDSPFPNNVGSKAYFTLLPSFTVIAGTYTDILLYITLDTDFLYRTAANEYLYNLVGLPENIDIAVTHISGTVCNLGEIINVDIDAATGNLLYEYQLVATSVPVPGALILLGSGLTCLGLYRQRKQADKK